VTKEEFAPMLWLLIPSLVRVLIDEKGLSFSESVGAVYTSKLYKALEDESTKLWHLSEYALASLLYTELEGGIVRYPEVAW
jgi:hypothetical protein